MADEKNKPKPKVGKLAMWDGEPARFGPPHPAQFAPPPFEIEAEQRARKNVSKLTAARRAADKLGAVVRDDAFDGWVSRYLLPSTEPAEWTQAKSLYENYLKRARRYGNSNSSRAHATLELATETQWGKMMGAVFPKKRRSSGWFYPVRLKRGA